MNDLTFENLRIINFDSMSSMDRDLFYDDIRNYVDYEDNYERINTCESIAMFLGDDICGFLDTEACNTFFENTTTDYIIINMMDCDSFITYSNLASVIIMKYLNVGYRLCILNFFDIRCIRNENDKISALLSNASLLSSINGLLIPHKIIFSSYHLVSSQKKDEIKHILLSRTMKSTKYYRISNSLTQMFNIVYANISEHILNCQNVDELKLFIHRINETMGYQNTDS